MFLSDERPTLETLDFTICIGSTPTFSQFRPDLFVSGRLVFLISIRQIITILYFHVTSLPFYLCRWWSNANDKVKTVEVVYDHVWKYRKLALCYFIQINLILFCLTTIWKSEMKQNVTWLKPKNRVVSICAWHCLEWWILSWISLNLKRRTG